jgi:hypothetical protein
MIEDFLMNCKKEKKNSSSFGSSVVKTKKEIGINELKKIVEDNFGFEATITNIYKNKIFNVVLTDKKIDLQNDNEIFEIEKNEI